ncbi:MAG: YbhB/YbcL family Raf kinase inhibitor-like protein [Patescibacteria group bacterium]|nr:YbhB/YbcL family Raf kinase inhibitor-like protein [Patescibacteria group bacterium]
MSLKIISSAFNENDLIPEKYTCDGENINPPITITGAPEKTKSLALIVDDPDAVTPTGSFVHWLLWNINPSICEIFEGEIPEGTLQGKNSAGSMRYEGPCPPENAPAHNYRFTIYALSEPLNIEGGIDKISLQQIMDGKILEQDQLVGRYQRKSS